MLLLFARFTQRNILRVFPKGTRVTSSNFKPMTGWMHGAQMVAFNMQVTGTFMFLYPEFISALDCYYFFSFIISLSPCATTFRNCCSIISVLPCCTMFSYLCCRFLFFCNFLCFILPFLPLFYVLEVSICLLYKQNC